MRFLYGAAALLSATVTANTGCAETDGNWYCSAVNAITYTGVGGDGEYNRITSMSKSGQCASEPFSYSGSLSPLNEEVSFHIRGPFNLKQFAVYTPGRQPSKKSRRGSHLRDHDKRIPRGHLHHHHRVEERQVGATVTATINGVVETWINTYDGLPDDGPAAPAPVEAAAEASSSSPAANPMPTASEPLAGDGDDSDGSGTSLNSPPAPIAPYSGAGWRRRGYYNAATQTSRGLVFLNHFGGTGSGVFDYNFGNSLSYATSDGQSGASSPQILTDATIPSTSEIVIMSNKQCNEQDGDCGYYRPGTVAHHGFDGEEKAFFLEFSMPDDGQTTTNIYEPVNMPALWMLNAQIPRTLQYGNEECSCWTSGCGEFDIFEVLTPGETKCKSTMHGNKAGGDSNYFDRPVDSPIKVAVVLHNNNMHVKVLESDFDFGRVVDSNIINEIVESTSVASDMVSLFNLAEANSG